MAKYVRENLNLLVAINVYYFAIQVPALLVQRWSQLHVTVRKQNLSPAGAVPSSGLVSCHVGASCFVGIMSVKILVMQEIASLVQELVDKNVCVAKKKQKEVVRAQCGTVIKCVERRCHVVIIHVSKFVMLVLVESVLAPGRGPVHVRNQSFLCPVQKMYQLVVTAVTKCSNVESTGAHSAATEGLVKHADKKWKSSVAVGSIQNECHVTSLIFVRQSV